MRLSNLGGNIIKGKKMHLENHYPEQILAVSMLFQAGGCWICTAALAAIGVNHL